MLVKTSNIYLIFYFWPPKVLTASDFLPETNLNVADDFLLKEKITHHYKTNTFIALLRI